MTANLPPAGRSVLVLGNYRPTLTVVRSLSRAGFQIVLGLGHDPEGSAQYSRHVDEVWDHPRLEAGDGKAFGAALRELLAARPDIRIIYPVTEAIVRWLADNQGDLPPGVLVASPPADIVKTCLDKLRMAECATREGVPCQPFAAVRSLEELCEQARRIGYPVVVRPLDHLLRLGKKKAVILKGPEHVLETFPAWPEGHTSLLVQKFARGERRNVYFAAHDGAIACALEVRALRTDSLDGTGLSVESETIHPTRLTEYTGRLARRLGYTGIGCAQFLIDPPTGAVSFLEINPRITGSHRCTDQLGMNLTRLAISLADGTAAVPPGGGFEYEAGTRFCWTYGDLGGLKTALASGEVGLLQAIPWLARTAVTLSRARFHQTWDRADPWPTLLLYVSKLPGLGWLARARLARIGGSVI